MCEKRAQALPTNEPPFGASLTTKSRLSQVIMAHYEIAPVSHLARSIQSGERWPVCALCKAVVAFSSETTVHRDRPLITHCRVMSNHRSIMHSTIDHRVAICGPQLRTEKPAGVRRHYETLLSMTVSLCVKRRRSRANFTQR